MALIDRMRQTEEPRLPAHEFTDTLILWAEGEVTRADVIAWWSISVAEEAELDAIKSAYDALNANGKKWYPDKLERAIRMLQLGNPLTGWFWSKAAFAAYIGV
jgi:hypothetical protein